MAVANGAVVEYGNKPIDHPGNFVMPTVITGIDKNNPLYNKEVFGPVGEVYKVKDEAEAIALANDSSYSLSGEFLDIFECQSLECLSCLL